MPNLPEAWLRGPVPAVPALLQPVAHALLQAREELTAALAGFPPALLAARPAGVASVGFHLQHLTGVLSRLLTYARRESLTERQLAYFHREEAPPTGPTAVADLLAAFSAEVDAALAQLKATGPATLLEPRGVGRAQVPSTHLGLLFHAAEHTMRHVGQVLVTAKVVVAG